jgi:hypothetical protein
MNLSTILTNYGASGSTLSSSQNASTNASTAAKAAAAASPLTQAGKRIEAQAQATQTQLSKLGVIKSSIADIQTQSKAMKGVTANTSATELTSTMGKFFNSYNAAVTAANGAASSPSDAGLLSSSARKAATELRRALTSDTEASAAMKKLGIKVNADGTLTQDAKVFAELASKDPAALRSAMVMVGTKLGAAADRELASNARIETTASSLSQRSTLLAAQQKAIKAYTG